MIVVLLHKTVEIGKNTKSALADYSSTLNSQLSKTSIRKE